MEVCDIVQEAVVKTIPKRKRCKKAKWLSEEALQRAEKRREARSKGEKERYSHLRPHGLQQARFPCLPVMSNPLRPYGL